MRLVSILLIISTVLTVKTAHARDVGVVVWVEDIAAFNKTSYRIEMDHYRKTNPDLDFKTVYFKSSNTKNFESRFEDFIADLKNDEKISLLIIATHGNTDYKTNRTTLSKIGSFGEDGSDGHLKTMIDMTAHRFSPDLKILLESCSTYCGTKEELLQRTRGLYNDLSQHGVNNLSVWGATQTMMTSQLDRRTYFTFLKSVNSKVAKVVLPLGIVASIATNDLQPLIFSGTLMASINALAVAQYKTSGTRGYQVEMNKGQQWAAPRDYYSESLFVGSIRCQSVFSR